MNAIILSIGDELVLGQTVDTNSAWISQKLASVGCDILAHKTVADDRVAIARTILEESPRCDVLIVSGGIGPTEDDLTRDALADAMGVSLELDQSWADHMQAFFTKLGRKMPERNLVQATVPKGASILWNHNGTAPGLRATLGLTTIFVMPGVPKEMFAMFERDVFPFIRERSGGAVILQKTLHTFGVGESTVAERLGPLMTRGRNPSVGTTVSGGIVSVRINARFESLERAQVEMGATLAAARAALGSIVFGEDQQTLQDVVASLLREKKKTVATAESCTGGLVAKMLTDLAGSSEYLKYGWVVYSNEAKTQLLGVGEDILKAYGAVSEPVVRELAFNALHQADADYAIAISGIAGPGGGSEAKPVGTVCFALASWDAVDDQGAGGADVMTRTFVFPGDREWVRDRSAKMALTLLRYQLLGEPLPF
jgi:nicotinamide-nucleotide amidase